MILALTSLFFGSHSVLKLLCQMFQQFLFVVLWFTVTGRKGSRCKGDDRKDAGPRCEDVKAGREDAVRRCWPKTQRRWPRRRCQKTLAQDAEMLSEDAGPRRGDAGRGDAGRGDTVQRWKTWRRQPRKCWHGDTGKNCGLILSAAAAAGWQIFSLCPFVFCLLVLDRVGRVMGFPYILLIK